MAQWHKRNYTQPGAKRRVPFNGMAARDWLKRAPNRNSNGQARKRDQTTSFSRNSRASSLFWECEAMMFRVEELE